MQESDSALETATLEERFNAAERELRLLRAQIDSPLLIINAAGDIEARVVPGTDKIAEYFLSLPMLTAVSFANIDKEILNDFFELFFDKRRNENMLRAINPLKKVRIHASGLEDRYLSFSFQRFHDTEELTQAIVRVKDITRELEHAERLEAERQENDRKTEILFKIIHVDAALLAEFMDSASSGLEAINTALKKESLTPEQKLKQIARIAHSIKGNAGMLELDFFRHEVHRFEDEVRHLQSDSTTDGSKFITLLNMKEGLKKNLNDMEALIEKLSNFKMETGSAIITEKTKILNVLRQLVQKVAQEENKSVELDASAINFESIPNRYLAVVREFLVQAIQNAIIHGIESPDERNQNNKPKQAVIRLQLAERQGNLELTVADDGRGLNLDKLKQLAFARGVSADKIARLTPAQIASIILVAGVSTAAATTERAGRGVGLDMLRDSLHAVGGKLRIAFREGDYLQLTAQLPIAS